MPAMSEWRPTPKQKKFIDGVVAGLNYADAYREAYPASKKWNAKSVGNEAQKLLQNPGISLEIENLQKEASKKAVWSREMAVERFQRLNDLAVEEIERDGYDARSSAVRAFELTADRLNRYCGVDAEAEGTHEEGLPVIDTADLVPGAWSHVWRDIMAASHDEYLARSGRGSLKSTVLLTEAPLMLMLKDPRLCGVAFRRVGNTLRDSIYATFVSSIRRLGLEDYFEWTTNPMEIRRKDTGQSIMFRGLDDEGKAKSLQLADPDMYIGFSVWEEFDQCKGPASIRTIEQTIKRGHAPHFFTFRAWNTHPDDRHWSNEYFDSRRSRDDVLTMEANYTDMPADMLGEAFIADAEFLREVNPRAYANEYLGECTGLGGRVFEHVEAMTITEEDIADFKQLRVGVDWGFSSDPWVTIVVAYDSKRKVLYIVGEEAGVGVLDEEAVERTEHLLGEGLGLDGYKPGEWTLYADAAEPKAIATWNTKGINMKAARKWKGSVKAGIRWLQNRAAIYIDPKRCPLAWGEFTHYSFTSTPDGEFTTELPDEDNHTIDAVRYALSSVITKKSEV